MWHHSDWANLCFLVVGSVLMLYWLTKPKGQRPEKTILLVLTFMLTYSGIGFISVFVVHRSIAPEPPTLFEHLQPTLLFWGMAFMFLVAPRKGFGYPIKWLVGPSLPITDKEWDLLSRTLGVLFIIIGSVNLVVFYVGLRTDWVGFKESTYILFILITLTRFNFIWSVIFEQGIPILYRKYNNFWKNRKPPKANP